MPVLVESSEAMSTEEHGRVSTSSTEEEAFESIFLRYYPLVYRLAYHYVGQPDEAEDIAQEVFLRFYHLPPHASHEAQQRAWLCRVAINLGLNVVRKRKSRLDQEQPLDAAMLSSADEQDPERLVLAEEQAALVRDILASLPERQQVCLGLRSVGLSYEAISEATGIPLASIGSVLVRAGQAFRRNYHERTRATRTTN
ncbi:MAG TPA: sigma-70 family RNA polymerase sigma factor [Ktedonobacteraceae bacterium]|nr:sigma-70 family RNA polymerase sigma factor [Ktedonobacteraceae bacterium]